LITKFIAAKVQIILFGFDGVIFILKIWLHLQQGEDKGTASGFVGSDLPDGYHIGLKRLSDMTFFLIDIHDILSFSMTGNECVEEY
jgi:hypothetical protein